MGRTSTEQVGDLRTSIVLVLKSEVEEQSSSYGMLTPAEFADRIKKKRARLLRASMKAAGWRGLGEFVRAIADGAIDVPKRRLY